MGQLEHMVPKDRCRRRLWFLFTGRDARAEPSVQNTLRADSASLPVPVTVSGAPFLADDGQMAAGDTNVGFTPTGDARRLNADRAAALCVNMSWDRSTGLYY
jgi:hypothetical protein